MSYASFDYDSDYDCYMYPSLPSIVIDGLPGSGKTSVLKALGLQRRIEGVEFVSYPEPSHFKYQGQKFDPGVGRVFRSIYVIGRDDVNKNTQHANRPSQNMTLNQMLYKQFPKYQVQKEKVTKYLKKNILFLYFEEF